MKTLWIGLILVGVAGSSVLRAEQAVLERREWQVDGISREGLVAVPATAKSVETPVVFAFHGHGGNMRQAARSFGYEKVWPEAIVVYLQGLNTPGRLTDPEGKRPGWQHSLGAEGDRDLKFFDKVLDGLKSEYKVDARRIYWFIRLMRAETYAMPGA